MTVAAAAGLGCLVGALLPHAIRAIPDREPVPGDPPHTPYRTLGAAPRLAPLLAVLTAAVWALLTASLGAVPELPAYLLFGALGVAMAYVDVREHRLPDWLTYAAFAGAAGLLAVAALVPGEWGNYGRSWLGALAMVVVFLALALLRPGELGLGDVKLAASLGMLLGWIGWAHVVLGGFLGFLFGGVYSLVLVLARRAGRRSQVPFGPFLIGGAVVAIAWGDPLLAAYLGGPH